jgi:hypothetical protein
MPRPREVDRSTVAETNVTFRASRRTRALLDGLVGRAKEKAAAVGGSASMGSYLTAMIEREATAEGIRVEEAQEPPAASPAKKSPARAAPPSKLAPPMSAPGKKERRR